MREEIIAKGLYDRKNRFERIMDDLKTEEVLDVLEKNRKVIWDFYAKESKSEIVDGRVQRSINLVQLTKVLINKKIVPELLPKSTVVQLFKNV